MCFIWLCVFCYQTTGTEYSGKLCLPRSRSDIKPVRDITDIALILLLNSKYIQHSTTECRNRPRLEKKLIKRHASYYIDTIYN